MKIVKLKVKGMHCKSCEMLLADALEDLGVSESKVDSKTGLVEVGFDETKLDEEKVRKVIEGEGYTIE